MRHAAHLGSGVERREEVLPCLTVVEDDRQTAFAREAEVPGEDAALVLPGRQLVVVVETDLAERDWIELVGPGEAVALVMAGLVGGLLSGLAAVGENTIMFVLLVLGFRVCERVVTPTTVVLLTIVTWTGFLTHLLVMGDFRGPVVDMWLSAVPVVAVGAPAGALLCTRMSRDVIVRILYVLISVEFTSTVLLVPMPGGQGVLFGIAIAAFSLICVRLATWRRYRVSDTQLASVGASG